MQACAAGALLDRNLAAPRWIQRKDAILLFLRTVTTVGSISRSAVAALLPLLFAIWTTFPPRLRKIHYLYVESPNLGEFSSKANQLMKF